MPVGWNASAVRAGADLAHLLGATTRLGMVLGLIENGGPAREVAVTQRAADHLSMSVGRRGHTIGSLIGHLDGVTSHEGRQEARLWLDQPPRLRVVVRFNEEQFEEIRHALKRRVMISGQLERGATGLPISIRMRSLEILQGVEDAPSLATFAGAAPDLTAGLDPVDFVRIARDAA